MLAALAVAATAAPAATTDRKPEDNFPIIITIPDSEEVVKTDVPRQSAIPECLKRQPNVTEKDGVLVVTAEAFTECAKTELTRLETEINTPNDDDDSSEESAEEDVEDLSHKNKLKEEGVTPTAPKEEVKPEVKPEEPPKKKPAEPQPKPVLTSAPKVPDLTSITDAFAEVKPIAQNPSVLADVIKILQTIFDFKRIMNDMQRILHGDLKGVLQEYPERAAGFFRMVHNLPHRFLGAKEKVEEVQRASKEKDSKYVGVLDNLHKYLDEAAVSSKELPKAASLVTTVDTLRTIARQLRNNVLARVSHEDLEVAEETTGRSGVSKPSKLLNEIKDIFYVIPDSFRHYARRSKLNGGPGIFSPDPFSPLGPLGILNPLSPAGPLSPVGSLSPLASLNPLRSYTRRPSLYQDFKTTSLSAVDTVSKTVYGLLNSRRSGSKDVDA